MNNFIRKIDEKPSFEKENYFKGYSFLQENSQMDLDYIDMTYGHDYYQIDTEATHIYYILDGQGEAKIAEERTYLEKGLVVEIPKNTEWAFRGNLKMLEISLPKFNPETCKYTRKNDL